MRAPDDVSGQAGAEVVSRRPRGCDRPTQRSPTTARPTRSPFGQTSGSATDAGPRRARSFVRSTALLRQVSTRLALSTHSTSSVPRTSWPAERGHPRDQRPREQALHPVLRPEPDFVHRTTTTFLLRRAAEPSVRSGRRAPLSRQPGRTTSPTTCRVSGSCSDSIRTTTGNGHTSRRLRHRSPAQRLWSVARFVDRGQPTGAMCLQESTSIGLRASSRSTGSTERGSSSGPDLPCECSRSTRHGMCSRTIRACERR